MGRVDDALRRAAAVAPPTARFDPDRSLHVQSAVDEYYLSDSAEPGSSRTAQEADALASLGSAHPRKMVVGADADPIVVEQFRRLAGAVHELQVEQELRMLLVTSAVPQEGKTLTTVNLALTLAEGFRRRVLLLDADVRRPSVHRMFQLDNAGGLGSLLASHDAPLDPVRVSPRLSVLPTGRVDEPMALASDRMAAILARCAASHDCVLIDAPPAGIVPEARLLARLARAVLFVISAHATPRALVERAIAEIGQEHLIGTVLNGVDPRDIPAGGYYGYYTSNRP